MGLKRHWNHFMEKNIYQLFNMLQGLRSIQQDSDFLNYGNFLQTLVFVKFSVSSHIAIGSIFCFRKKFQENSSSEIHMQGIPLFCFMPIVNLIDFFFFFKSFRPISQLLQNNLWLMVGLWSQRWLGQSEVRKCLMTNNTIHSRSLTYFSLIG